ncbi:diacylglycerol/lipid kinase family protein [Arthrobacter sp. ERGS1:01]|uniref:diacylglycerol/lipid kinase family protein n=1 Tax=Arthrobacter sp. ERGS1:01 TaxID=1704044 RepID=UPI0009E939E4|nr:diacylglycerol kinase family protein [Arthrobacter sp. ERGS1:01]
MTAAHSADDGATTPPLPGPPQARARILSIAVAVNPRAAFGGRRSNTTGQVGDMAVERLRAAGHTVTVLRRRNYAELRDAVLAALDSGAQALLVVGGDGMVHLGVNALAGRSIPLGIIPAGTGNDAARGLGLDPKDPAAAVEHFLKAAQGEPRALDLGRIDRDGNGPVWFMCALSAGFDALVNERANGWRWPHGPMRYNLAILRELATLKPLSNSLVVDGVPRQERAVLISVSNGPSIGGGMKITPDARTDDGLLDLFIVAPVSRLTFLRIYPLVYSGRHTGHPVVSIERVTSVDMDSAGLVAYADGERIGSLPATVRVDPGALRVWA